MMRMYRRKFRERIKKNTKGSLVETRNTISLKEKRIKYSKNKFREKMKWVLASLREKAKKK